MGCQSNFLVHDTSTLLIKPERREGRHKWGCVGRMCGFSGAQRSSERQAGGDTFCFVHCLPSWLAVWCRPKELARFITAPSWPRENWGRKVKHRNQSPKISLRIIQAQGPTKCTSAYKMFTEINTQNFVCLGYRRETMSAPKDSTGLTNIYLFSRHQPQNNPF